jgi:Ca-activated chloride channel family protein
MGTRPFAIVRISTIVALGVALMAQKNSANDGRRIFVVAVRDSSLFTMCPSAKQQQVRSNRLIRSGDQLIRTPDGAPLILPAQVHPQLGPTLQPPHPDWLDLPPTTPGLCPSGRIDADLRQQIEKELSNRKEYTLVDSAERAELVFLAEGCYNPQASTSGARGARGAGKGPPTQDFLMVAMAIAAPADVYRQYPANSEVLLKASIWEGAESFKLHLSDRGRRQPYSDPASIRSLVKSFIGRKKPNSRFPPLCAVFTSPIPTSTETAQSLPGAGERSPSILPGSAPGIASGNRVYKIDVELVTVPVIARDPQHRYVPDLTEQDFHVFENGVEQRIDRIVPVDAPFDVALMLDTSNSTIIKHEEIQKAALAFVEALRPADRVMIISFGSSINLHCEFTGNRDLLRLAITRTQVMGNTRLYDAVDLVMTGRLSRLQGRKAIVLYTDGFDTQSSLASDTSTLARAQESDVLVYVIRYDTKPPDISRQAAARGLDYLHGLSNSSGGRLFNASSVRSLRAALAEIADELRHQYAICYYPSERPGDGSFRLLRVTVDKPNVILRARTGYRAAAAPRR